jgi:hypothetical protein
VSMRQTATVSMAVLSGRTSRVPEADHGNNAHQCWAEVRLPLLDKPGTKSCKFGVADRSRSF